MNKYTSGGSDTENKFAFDHRNRGSSLLNPLQRVSGEIILEMKRATSFHVGIENPWDLPYLTDTRTVGPAGGKHLAVHGTQLGNSLFSYKLAEDIFKNFYDKGPIGGSVG